MSYVISGRVIRGDGYGKKLGFPTVNLETQTKNLPEEGIYSGTALLENKSYRAGIVISPGRVEAHLIEYNGDAYGREVTLEINKFLREYKKFDTEEELIIQIKKYIKLC